MEENILKIIRPSILTFLPSFFVPLAILLVPFHSFKPVAYSVFWVLEILICFNALAFVYSSKYKIGTTRLVTTTFSKSTFSFDTVAINYSNIQEINIHQSFIQSFLQIGDLTVDTAGVGRCQLSGVENPDSIMKFILDLKEGTK